MNIFLVFFVSTFYILPFSSLKIFNKEQFDTKTNLKGPETTIEKIDARVDSSKTTEAKPTAKGSRTLTASKRFNLHDQIATSKEFPYYVLVENFQNYIIHAGSIISPIWIITTARVLFGRGIEVGIKISDLEKTEQSEYVYPSIDLVPHPRYNPLSKHYNIGLVKCVKITFNDKVNSIKLPTIDSSPDIFTGKNFLVIGWAHSDIEDSKPYAKYRTLAISANASECNEQNKNYEGFLCASFTDESSYFLMNTGHSIVANSSGEHILIGVNSEMGTRLLYTSLRFYLLWIKYITDI